MMASPADAGPIFFHGELQSGKFVWDKAAKEASCYAIRYSTITATADDASARVQIVESIEGPEKGAKTVCIIPLPHSAKEEGLSIIVADSGEEAAVVKTAKFLKADEAQKTYEALSRGLDSVAILTFTGQPAILIPQFELKGKKTFTIEFRQPLGNDQNLLSLQCPTPVTHWASGPVGRLTLTATIASRQPLRAMFSPTHNAAVERDGLHKATARVKANDWAGTDDFRLCWVAAKDDLGLRVLTYREEGEEDGYFMLLGNPTGGGEKPVDRDVFFVLDTSGSMRGEKMEQARAAIDYCVTQLKPGDRFNIVTFGTDVETFQAGPVPATEKTISAARDYVERLVAQGRTNIGGALEAALADKAPSGRPRIMIFLTDGTPTAGELSPERILEKVRQANTSGTKIFVMGVGHDVNAHLLDKLAEQTDGSSEYVSPQEEIDAKVATLYDRLSHPVLTNVAVAFGGLRTYSVYPKKLPALFKGSEVMVFGRYQEGGKHTVKITGQLHGKPVEYACAIDAPKSPTGQATNFQAMNFVAPLWAARNIGHLLQELRLHGPNDELIKEVVRLSKKFGVVTEYTAFLSQARPGGVGGAAAELAAVADAKGRLDVANRQQAGQWAVNQAINDKQLQDRVVAGREGNVYRDRRGRTVGDDNIRQIGSRVYYLSDGQWLDSQDAGKRKTRVVKLYSDEYYNLLRNNSDFAKAQQLGWAMELNIGNERIAVEKDGQRKDEKLRAVQRDAQQNQQQGQIQDRQQFRNFQQQFDNNAPNRQQRDPLPPRDRN
jgi:Ca-activated chloride channel family protein